MIAVILQARLESTRLPRKALLPLSGEPLLFRAMEALRHIHADAFVLACPRSAERDFSPLAERAGFSVVTGPADDVLKRYTLAIESCGCDMVVRATGDNPFPCADAADEIVNQALALGSDYASYAGLPYGAGVEAVRSESLLLAEREATESFEREHVCPYLYGHPDRFILHRPAAPTAWRDPSFRVTVDLAEDLRRAELIFDALRGPCRVAAPALVGIRGMVDAEASA